MEDAVIVNGRLTGPRSVELDEPVSEMSGEVEVILLPRSKNRTRVDETVSALLQRLPAGTRPRDEIDRQLREERQSWER